LESLFFWASSRISASLQPKMRERSSSVRVPWMRLKIHDLGPRPATSAPDAAEFEDLRFDLIHAPAEDARDHFGRGGSEVALELKRLARRPGAALYLRLEEPLRRA